MPVWFTVRGDLRYRGRAFTKVNTGKEEGIWVRLHPGTLPFTQATCHLSIVPQDCPTLFLKMLDKEAARNLGFLFLYCCI